MKPGLWIDEDEMIRRLGLPGDVARAAIQELERHGDFPQKWPLFGNRRWWPAVLNFFLTRYGGLPSAATEGAAQTWEEDFDAVTKPTTRKAIRAAGPRTELAQAG